MSALPEPYRLSLDPADIDAEAAHAFLASSYWSPGIPLAVVEQAIANSVCVSAHRSGEQVGFARVITDRATIAYLADVYVLESHRGLGIARAMVGALQDHPELQGLRRWVLATKDAHALYASLGWEAPEQPGMFMQRYFPDIYA